MCRTRCRLDLNASALTGTGRSVNKTVVFYALREGHQKRPVALAFVTSFP
jgi:hypothetical protein